MNWKTYSQLNGQHAFLSASKYHWVQYDNEKLQDTYLSWQAVKRGTEYHELASRLINLGVKLPKTQRTLNLFVNDAIGFKMQTEQCLYYSPNCFGTCDAICFRNNQLRIHDLKTGKIAANMTQLDIYAALFCLDYNYNPNDIQIELRIYQFDEVQVTVPEPTDILYIMDKIKSFDNQINQINKEM